MQKVILQLDLVANNGTFVDNGNNTWTFTDRNYNGTVDLNYKVSDGSSDTNQTHLI